MRCVKEALPPRPRLRWLLITVRLSTSSFAGTARTLVAVGTARLASMLATTREAAPRSGRRSLPAAAVGGAADVVASAFCLALSCLGAAFAGAGVLDGAAAVGAGFAVLVADEEPPLPEFGT